MRLLVVEDEHSLREDIARKLRLSGYEVDACADGEAALEALAAERYDLVLLDLNLPKVDGMQVLRSLRRHDLETCVLILSARSEISDKVEGLDAGANDYLSKPFHLAELEARVRSLTRRKFIQAAGVPVFPEHSIAQVVEALDHNAVLGGGEVYLEFPFFHRAFLLYAFSIYRRNTVLQMCDLQSDRS